MYIDRIGGTGKLQVIRSVLAFLHTRNEEYRYLVVTLTGTVAYNVDNSTYHLTLNLNISDCASMDCQLAQLQEHLASVDFVIIDKILMVSCLDLYKVSSQLSLAFNTPLESFGNKHVLLAGDFGQLPLASKATSSLYSNSASLNTLVITLMRQKSVLGKAIW